MKKFAAILLAIVLVICSFSLTVTAKSDYNGYPIVLVPGYASASLCYEEDGKVYSAWGWKAEDLTTDFANNGLSLLRGIDLLLRGDDGYFINAVGASMQDLFSKMECNPDGTSKKNVRPVLFNADVTNDKYMNKVYPEGDYRVELDMTRALDELVGAENVFYFNCDFRMSAVKCAEILDEYITQVKDFTGKDKVNIIAVSHGGLITSAYVSLYMQKQDVNNIVMDEPALEGAHMAADFLNNSIELDEESLTNYLEYHSQAETDFDWFLKSHPLDMVDDAASRIVPGAIESVKYWGSLWDFVPLSEYEQLKKVHLDETASAELIAQSDYVHYEIMGHYREIFEKAKALGMNINIIAGAGHKIITGTNENSDGIITVASSTGAACAPYGKRFSSGYVQAEGDDARMISPWMNIDASTCYLPYNTWFVNGLYHGMEFWDEYSRSLLLKLVTATEPMDVYSDSYYTRFHDTTSVTSSVYSSFDKSDKGYLTIEDNALVIKNISSKYQMAVLSVKCDGINAQFDWDIDWIKPGESTIARLKGTLPEGTTYTQVTVTYFLLGSITPLNQRKQNFTVSNGEAQGEAEEYIDSEFKSDFEKKAHKKIVSFVEKIGFTDFVDVTYDASSELWKRFKNLFK
ncbi:MAG: alpha/beta fold hydrolase [Clostridia bacterium]|nr:alpha/beta fold hydrolase [Clostridia bacterium]